MARVLALVEELMLASRVEGSLRAAGHDVTLSAALPGGDESFDLIVCDLDVADLDAVSSRAEPAIGFYSHVDTETRERAVEAGMELVIPRSRMSRELPNLVERLLGERKRN